MKKGRWILISLLLVIVLGVVLIVITERLKTKREEENIKIPYITFMHNFNRADCLFLCSDGSIYASTSEEAFLMSFSELAEKAEQKKYEGILELVGTTDAQKVREMYHVFYQVVVEEGIRFNYPMVEPNVEDPESEKERHYWKGLYYSDEGELEKDTFFIAKKQGTCSDERLLALMDWLHGCLSKHMKYSVTVEWRPDKKEGVDRKRGNIK